MPLFSINRSNDNIMSGMQTVYEIAELTVYDTFCVKKDEKREKSALPPSRQEIGKRLKIPIEAFTEESFGNKKSFDMTERTMFVMGPAK